MKAKFKNNMETIVIKGEVETLIETRIYGSNDDWKVSGKAIGIGVTLKKFSYTGAYIFNGFDVKIETKSGIKCSEQGMAKLVDNVEAKVRDYLLERHNLQVITSYEYQQMLGGATATITDFMGISSSSIVAIMKKAA